MNNIYLRVSARTDIGLVRRRNEDAFIASDLTRGESHLGERWTGRVDVGEQGALLAVSDGMGGAKAGDVASALVVESLARSLSTRGQMASQPNITVAVEEAHKTVWDESCKRGVEMGATLTAVYMRGSAAYIAEVGDSRAYLLRGGTITQLTKDQSYVQMLLDSGVVGPDEVQQYPLRNVVLQAMGHGPNVSVALGKLELRWRDCFLICSDGVSGVISDEEMRGLVLSSPDLASATERLVDLANARGGRDNATVVLAGVGGELPVSEPHERVRDTFRVLEEFEA